MFDDDDDDYRMGPAIAQLNSQCALNRFVFNDGRCVLVAGDVCLTLSWVSAVFIFGKRIQVT